MSAASTSGRPLRRAEDLESAPAFHDVGRSERSRHPMSEGVGSLACACDEPQAPSLEQMRRRFADDPIHDAATGADGRVANDVVERHVGRSEEHTSELQSRGQLVCRLLLEKKKPVRVEYRLTEKGLA